MPETPVLPDDLVKVLPEHLTRQRWYAGAEEPEEVLPVALGDPLLVPGLVHVGVKADGVLYQLVLAHRPLGEPAEFLRGHEAAVLGEADGDFWYDGLLDPELSIALLAEIAPDLDRPARVRPAGVEQSNTSLVYDEAAIAKFFRRLGDGPNPEAEITIALADVGFAHVAEPLAVWRHEQTDLAVVQRFLSGAMEGWAMALTSLRDLLGLHDTQQMPAIRADEAPPDDSPLDPAAAGGDFAGEAERLGGVTAELHVALARALGRDTADTAAWADAMEEQLERVQDLALDRAAAGRVFSRLRDVRAPGPAIRVHGDLHLGQVMRADSGWFVLDFEGEPARTLAERRRPTSALKDVAGMLRSFHYASRVALMERPSALAQQAAVWEERNREAFLAGYLDVARAGDVLPRDQASTEVVLLAFELDKAVYELGYELAHRPDWADIPRAAIQRLLAPSEPAKRRRDQGLAIDTDRSRRA